jgi:hypothetical protein
MQSISSVFVSKHTWITQPTMQGLECDHVLTLRKVEGVGRAQHQVNSDVNA